MTIEVICGDALDVLRSQPSGRFGWSVSSPPYNVGKSYERRTSMSAYQEWVAPIVAELVRVVRPGGSICWQVGYHVDKGSVLPLDWVFIPMFQTLGMVLRHRIIWKFGHGLHCKYRFSGRHETILWFTKGDPGIDYAAARERLGSVWDIPNVKHNHREKTAHPCQFPSEIVHRLISEIPLTGTGVDPFGGAGTTGFAAAARGMDAVLIELLPEYAEIARSRIAGVTQFDLGAAA